MGTKGWFYRLIIAVNIIFTFTACNDDSIFESKVGDFLNVLVNTCESRAIINTSYLPSASQIGITVLDESTYGVYHGTEYNNLSAQSQGSGDSQTWTMQTPVTLYDGNVMAIAYYPYSSSSNDYTAIPVAAGTTDYMYSNWVKGLNAANNTAQFTMKHALTGLKFIVRKDNYSGQGTVSELKVRSVGLGTSAKLNIENGTFFSINGGGDFFSISASGTIGTNGWSKEWLGVPTSTNGEIELVFTIDGKKFTKIIQLEKVFQAGERTIFNFLLNEDELTCTSIDIEPWVNVEAGEENAQKYSSYLTLLYNVTSTSSYTSLFNTNTDKKNYISEMYIDGISVSPVMSYKFSSTGLHEVKFKFKDETKLPNIGFSSNIKKIISFPSEMRFIEGEVFKDCTGITNLPGFPEHLKEIGEYAFKNCDGITSLKIPPTVDFIGKGAFTQCKELNFIEVDENNEFYSSCNGGNVILEKKTGRIIVGTNNSTLPDNYKMIDDNAFYGCTELKNVTIPNSVTSIGEYAFYQCESLKEIAIPNSVTTISNYVFGRCKGLTEVIIPNSVTTIGVGAFYECTQLESVFISNLVTSIGNYAFKGCTRITEINIPESVEYIGEYAFQDCKGLQSFIIPNAVKSINVHTFDGCTGLTNVTIPNSVTSISAYAFRNCKELTEVIIPNSVTNIGGYAFQDCNGLQSITIPNSVTSIGEYAFNLCKGLTLIDIPNSITSIGDNTFQGCTGLKEITIPNSVTSIGKYAFSGCTKLTEVTIPEGVTFMSNYTFSGCTGLTSVTMPKSITQIAYRVFQNCSSLTEITIPESVAVMSEEVFSGCSNLNKIISNCIVPPSIKNTTFSSIKREGILIIPNGCTDVYTEQWMNNYLTSYSWICVESDNEIGGIYYSNDGKTAMAANANYMGTFIIKSGTEHIRDKAFQNCKFIKDIELNEGLLTIGIYAFQGCTGLKEELVIPNSVTSIGNYAFYQCSGLTEITVGAGVQTIGTYAFSGCTGVKKLRLGENLQNIGDYAFRNLSNINTIEALADNPPVGNPNNPFYDCSTDGFFIVKKGCRKNYYEWVEKYMAKWIIVEKE